ncbi:MAG: quinol:electron acceptor oxidoreductase subunit ActD [Bryobacteraceae bacterium]
MANKNKSVFGIYADRVSVEEAVEALRAAGFRGTDISVLFQENQGTKDFAHEKNTKAPEGATTGGIVGGISGGVLGWLTGVGALAIPGLGPLIAAGPIAAALAGVGAAGAVGGFIGALIGMGAPEYEAKRFEGRIKQGGILMSVHCDNDDWVRRAKDLLRQTGAESVDSMAESNADYFVSDKPMPRVRRTAYSDPLSGPDEPPLPHGDEAARLP